MADKTDPVKELTGGFADGDEITNVIDAPTGEKVVADYDEEGALVGWHKETI